jgi:hypothetical protein
LDGFPLVPRYKPPQMLGVMPMNKFTSISILFLLSACSDNGYVQNETSKEISAQLETNDFKSINFSELGSDKWTKVCFLGPYN